MGIMSDRLALLYLTTYITLCDLSSDVVAPDEPCALLIRAHEEVA